MRMQALVIQKAKLLTRDGSRYPRLLCFGSLSPMVTEPALSDLFADDLPVDNDTDHVGRVFERVAIE